MSKHLTPLTVSERLIGGISDIAAVCGLSEKAPFHWKNAGGHHDAGDIRSTRQQKMLLRYSQEYSLGLTAEHLIFGATEDQVDAILANRSKVAAE